MKFKLTLAALSALLVCGTSLAPPAFAGDDTTKTDSGDGTGGGSGQTGDDGTGGGSGTK
jgi:hypothetical protein